MRGAKKRGMFGTADQRPVTVAALSCPKAGGPAGICFALTALLAGPWIILSDPAAAASRAEIRLRGVVPAVCTISVSDSTATLDIVQGGSDMQLARVTEQCNAAGGYTVDIESSNGGRMVQETGGAAVAYALTYDDAASRSDGGLSAERSTTGAPRQRTLSATLPATPRATAGTYADTITVSIRAK